MSPTVYTRAASILVPVLAAEGAVSSTSYKTVVDALKTAFTEAQLADILSYAVGACVVLVLFWWAVRKVSRMFMGAFKKGRLRI